MVKTMLFTVKATVEDFAEPREIRDDLMQHAEKLHGVIQANNAWYEAEEDRKGMRTFVAFVQIDAPDLEKANDLLYEMTEQGKLASIEGVRVLGKSVIASVLEQ